MLVLLLKRECVGRAFQAGGDKRVTVSIKQTFIDILLLLLGNIVSYVTPIMLNLLFIINFSF